MILGQPWLLLALLLLPVLWWLVRATPPAPRSQIFPALRLLADLQTAAQSPERTPPWLLALRLLIAACLILGLANPILHPGQDLPGRGPLLIVLDNGWGTAADWPDRVAAADAAITSAARTNRAVALLATAPGADGAPPALIGPLPATAIGARLRALAPLPWPSDHVAAAKVLDRVWRVGGGAVLYLSDGLTDGSATAWAAALGRAGAVTEMRPPVPAMLLLPPVLRDGRLILRLAAAPVATPRHFAVLAQGADGLYARRGRNYDCRWRRPGRGAAAFASWHREHRGAAAAGWRLHCWRYGAARCAVAAAYSWSCRRYRC